VSHLKILWMNWPRAEYSPPRRGVVSSAKCSALKISPSWPLLPLRAFRSRFAPVCGALGGFATFSWCRSHPCEEGSTPHSTFLQFIRQFSCYFARESSKALRWAGVRSRATLAMVAFSRSATLAGSGRPLSRLSKRDWPHSLDEWETHLESRR